MTSEYLHECFTYDQETGTLRWKEDRPLAHFADEKGRNIWRGRFAGKVTGTESNGYLLVWVLGKLVRAHRIAWIMSHGDIPSGMQIDHIDQNKINNRLSNLRLATRSQNNHNTGITSRNTSGAKGVCFHKQTGKWMARIHHNGRAIHLGMFKDIEEAASARADAVSKYHGEFAPVN